MGGRKSGLFSKSISEVSDWSVASTSFLPRSAGEDEGGGKTRSEADTGN
jgi:hypothetical protein